MPCTPFLFSAFRNIKLWQSRAVNCRAVILIKRHDGFAIAPHSFPHTPNKATTSPTATVSGKNIAPFGQSQSQSWVDFRAVLIAPMESRVKSNNADGRGGRVEDENMLHRTGEENQAKRKMYTVLNQAWQLYCTQAKVKIWNCGKYFGCINIGKVPFWFFCFLIFFLLMQTDKNSHKWV